MNTSRKYIHRFNNVTMLYADIKGFTALSTILTSENLVRTLNGLFVLGRSVGFIGHFLDQKRLKQGGLLETNAQVVLRR